MEGKNTKKTNDIVIFKTNVLIQSSSEKFDDTKGVIRRRKSKKNKQYNGQKCEDTKGVMRRRKSKKGRQYNGHKQI